MGGGARANGCGYDFNHCILIRVAELYFKLTKMFSKNGLVGLFLNKDKILQCSDFSPHF